jgi:hypothetical protein
VKGRWAEDISHRTYVVYQEYKCARRNTYFSTLSKEYLMNPDLDPRIINGFLYVVCSKQLYSLEIIQKLLKSCLSGTGIAGALKGNSLF